ncbi:MAG: Fic family protein [Microthrixaceae bacterium]
MWLGGATLDDAVFVPPPPDEMRDALSDLEKFLHETDLPLLVQLAIAHYQFEVIHPFLDGNGRIGRLMIPLMLVLRDALPQPLLYLSAFFEQHRSEYYDHLLITSQMRRPHAVDRLLPSWCPSTGTRLRGTNGPPGRATAPAPQPAARRGPAELRSSA